MNSIDKEEYFRKIEGAWRRWSRLLFLSSRDMEFLEELWSERIPLDVVLRSIEGGFTAVFRKKKKRMITLWNLKKKIYGEEKKFREKMAGAGEKWQEIFRVEGEMGELLKRAHRLLKEGQAEKALELEDLITEKMWKEAAEDEREKALNWAKERVKNLKISSEAKEEIALKGAKRRLRERKRIPFIF